MHFSFIVHNDFLSFLPGYSASHHSLFERDDDRGPTCLLLPSGTLLPQVGVEGKIGQCAFKKHACRACSIEDVICVSTASDTHSSEELHDSFSDTIPFSFTPRRRCCGMSVTTMPGRPSRAVFNWNAVWLCSGTSHQWATTNSGRMTVRVSSGYN